MEKEPDKQHDLILSIRLNRAPIDLESSLATNDERNECTQAFCDWEDLIEKQKSGDDSVTDNDIVAAYDYAMWLDSFVLEKDTIARSAYHEDYSALSRESCQPVYDSLKQVFGEKVAWSTPDLNVFAIRANRAEFLRLLAVDGIEQVSLDMPIEGFIDQSRLAIRADQVHSGTGGVGPYTGADVKVAIVDNGYFNTRLPSVGSSDQIDYSAGGGGATGGCTQGHGTQVAGVVFCRPDAGDSNVGIAYDATPVVAKTSAFYVIGQGCNTSSLPETWDNITTGGDLQAFVWAADTALSPIINFSRGGIIYGDDGVDNDTRATHYSAKQIDWIVDKKGVSFIHSCGNISAAAQLAPPSGSYNCISVGGFDDKGTGADRSDDKIWDDPANSDGTSPGPADDGRKKPDISAPAADINSTYTNPVWRNTSGTSFAAPHVAGVCALLKEARPSLTPRQLKAILINAVEYVPHPDGTNFAGNGVWNNQGGWGALDAVNAVKWRNYTHDDSIALGVTKTFPLHQSQPLEPVSVTLVWQRTMVDSITPATDSPGNLDLVLEGKRVSNGQWEYITSSESGDLDPPGDAIFDNVEQVYYANTAGTYSHFRVKVFRNDDHTNYVENFTLAGRRPFLSFWP
ncbi:MAG: S8 family serine peptidase [Fimbriimonadales bacterium]